MCSRFFSTSGVMSLIFLSYPVRCAGTRSRGRWLGRVRDVWRNVPPVRPARFTIASDSSCTFSLLSAPFSRE